MAQPLRRFFVPHGSLRARNVTLGGDLAHRLVRVLRLKRGDHIVLSEGGPREYEVQLAAVSAHAVTGVVVDERDSPPEPAVNLVLYQSLIRANRFDLVLEKGTEIGVSRFVPVINARSQVQAEEQLPLGRGDRLERIVIEAAEQSGRGRPPKIDVPAQFEQAIQTAPGLKLIPYEGEKLQGIGRYPARPRSAPRHRKPVHRPRRRLRPRRDRTGARKRRDACHARYPHPALGDGWHSRGRARDGSAGRDGPLRLDRRREVQSIGSVRTPPMIASQ